MLNIFWTCNYYDVKLNDKKNYLVTHSCLYTNSLWYLSTFAICVHVIFPIHIWICLQRGVASMYKFYSRAFTVYIWKKRFSITILYLFYAVNNETIVSSLIIGLFRFWSRHIHNIWRLFYVLSIAPLQLFFISFLKAVFH